MTALVFRNVTHNRAESSYLRKSFCMRGRRTNFQARKRYTRRNETNTKGPRTGRLINRVTSEIIRPVRVPMGGLKDFSLLRNKSVSLT